jgi:ribose transport system substrate-binding protein
MKLASALSIVLAALAAIGLSAGFSGCGSQSGDTTRRIILLTNGDDPFWDAMRDGMNKAASDLDLAKANLKVVVDKNNASEKGQVDKLKQYANQTDVAAVAISVIDADNIAIAGAMKALREKGVKVITIDSDVNREKHRDARFAYLGTNNVIGGQELGKAALGLQPKGGKYATFVGKKSAANAVERIRGFAEGAGGTFESLDSLEDGINDSKAQENVRIALNNHAEIDMLVGIWAYNADAIVQIVSKRGVRDKTKIVVFDAAEKAIRHMGDGNVDAMVVQNPYQMGYLGVKLMKAMLDGDDATISELYPSWNPTTESFAEPDGDVYTTELRVVVPDQSSPLTPSMFRDSTKFFYLDDFKQWLAERGLKGS